MGAGHTATHPPRFRRRGTNTRTRQAALRGSWMPRLASAFVDLWRDRRGAYSMVTALLLPVLAGFTAFGTEVGLWFYSHQAMQSAAVAGAFSAATDYFFGSTDYISDAYTVSYINGFPPVPS